MTGTQIVRVTGGETTTIIRDTVAATTQILRSSVGSTTIIRDVADGSLTVGDLAASLTAYVPRIVAADPTGVTDSSAAFTTADAAGGTIRPASGVYLFSNDTTLNSPHDLPRGVTLKPASGKTLILAGGLVNSSATWQVFDLSAGGTVEVGGEYVRPEWWGATPAASDGGAGLTAALSSCKSQGTTLRLRKQTYTHSALNLDPIGCRIKGNGCTLKVKDSTSLTTTTAMLKSTGWCHITGVTINMNAGGPGMSDPASNTKGIGIRFTNTAGWAERAVCRDVKVTTGYQGGIRIDGLTTPNDPSILTIETPILLDNCEVTACNWGLFTRYTKGVRVKGGKFSANTLQGINDQMSYEMSVLGAHCSNNGDDGCTTQNSWGWTVTGCHVNTNGGIGISVGGGSTTLSPATEWNIVGNTVKNNKSIGITTDVTVSGLPSLPCFGVISGNTVRGNYGSGISNTHSDYVLITGNVCDHNGSSGISVASSNVTVTGNTTTHNRVYGIGVFSTARNVTERGNTSYGNGAQTVSATADASTDTLTWTQAHGKSVNDPVEFMAIAVAGTAAPLVTGTTYYVKTAPSGTTMTLAATAGGSTINITSNGTLIVSQATFPPVTFDASTDTATYQLGAHGKSVGDNVTFDAVTAGGLVSSLPYFVKTVPSGTTMTLALTSGGATIDITSNGGGVDDSQRAGGLANNIHWDAAATGTSDLLGLPGTELAEVSYWPSSANGTDATTTSTTQTDLAADAGTATWSSQSASMFNATFYAPPSGVVVVTASASMKTAAGGTTLRMSLYDVGGAAAVGNSIANVCATAATGGYTRNEYAKRVTGLTPGTSYTFRLQWSSSSGANAASVQSGGGKGPVRMQVFSAL